MNEALKIMHEFEKGPDNDFAATPYICPAGKPTIGWGHVVLPGESFTKPITREEADEILLKDLEWAKNAVHDLVDCDLTPNEFEALVCFIFNIGYGNFEDSTMRRLLNEEKSKEECADEFDRWIYGGGKPLPGLERRRAAEKALFLKK